MKDSTSKWWATAGWILLLLLCFLLILAAYALFLHFPPSSPASPPTRPLVVETSTLIPGPPAGTPTATPWWHAYFTQPKFRQTPQPEQSELLQTLLTLIAEARQSIHIAAFQFDMAPVADALIAARKRGVEVRWVTDDVYGMKADLESGRRLFPRLRHYGVSIRTDHSDALMHNKFWLFDGRVVWTGSTNITWNGIFHNNNNSIALSSPPIYTIYEREFEEMWSGQFGPSSPSTVSRQHVVVNGTSVDVYFAPEDRVSTRLLPFLQKARRSVRFMAFSFTLDELGKALIERAQAGVDVKGIFEESGSETRYSELRRLYCAGLAVRQDGNPYIMHHKVFIIDGVWVITGSYNFSANADRRNDENVIILHNRPLARRYMAEFERRWAEAHEPETRLCK